MASWVFIRELIRIYIQISVSNYVMTTEVFSDGSGYFEIAGYDDKASLDARLYVWHKCFDKPYEHKDPCSNWFQIKVPKVYINDGILPKRQWNLGEIHLEQPRSGQKLDKCE
uniref:Transthyretin-like family protein n=1 Tax=Caenorhabditis tropicalis TaxID=1561998 RepID=A0A1I7TCB5_9PELO